MARAPRDEDLEGCSAEYLAERVGDLQERKLGLLAAIKREEEEHVRAAEVLRHDIARLKEAEQALLVQHRHAAQYRKDRLATLASAAAHLPPTPAPLPTPLLPSALPAAPLPLGTEVRVRDAPGEEWKYGTIDGYSGPTPLVRLKGWEKLLTWEFLEAKPAG